MKIQITLLLFAFMVVGSLTAQNKTSKIAAAAFQNIADKNYNAAAQNFGNLIKMPPYNNLMGSGKKDKTRIKTAAIFHYNYARALAFQGKYEDGLADLTAAEKAASQPQFFSFLKGIYKDHFFDNAVDYTNFSDDYKAFSDFPNIAYDVAPLLTARGQYEEALAIYSKALKKDKSGTNYYHAGLVNKLMGNQKEAKKMFEKGLAAFPTKKSPDNCSYQSIQILLLYELGQAAKAKELAAEILENNAADYCAQNNFAQLKFLTKKYEAAIESYQTLVTENPYYENGFLSIIRSYKELGQTERALTMLNDLLEIYPNYALALVERAGILSQQKKYAEAKVDIKKAIMLMPNQSSIQQLKNNLATK